MSSVASLLGLVRMKEYLSGQPSIIPQISASTCSGAVSKQYDRSSEGFRKSMRI